MFPQECMECCPILHIAEDIVKQKISYMYMYTALSTEFSSIIESKIVQVNAQPVTYNACRACTSILYCIL